MISLKKIYFNLFIILYFSTSSTCEFCGKICASEGTLKVHMRIKHTQKFECDECGDVLESKMDMRKHKAAKHAPEQV